jgi:teichuronic acid exporter
MVGGMLVNSMIHLAINSYYTRRLIGYGWRQQTADLLPTSGVCLLMGVLLWALGLVGAWNRWALLTVQCVTGAVIYGTAVLLLRKTVYADVVGYVARIWNRRLTPPVAATIGDKA